MRRKRKFDGTYDKRANTFTDPFGQKIGNLHSRSECEHRTGCAVHAPSDHAMRRFPIRIRIPGPGDIKPMHMERICPCGIGHPDPDDMLFWIERGDPSMGVHGCCGKHCSLNA